MSQPLHTCPICAGKKGSECHHNTGPDSSEHYWGWSECMICKGAGEVDSDTIKNIEVGKMLRAARIAAGLSFIDAAKKYGVSPATISGIESRGKPHTDAPGFIALLREAGEKLASECAPVSPSSNISLSELQQLVREAGDD